MGKREEILRNPVFSALKEVGHKPEDDIYVWSQGMAFHNQNLLDGLKQNVKDPAVRDKILHDLWSFLYGVGMEKVNKVNKWSIRIIPPISIALCALLFLSLLF